MHLRACIPFLPTRSLPLAPPKPTPRGNADSTSAIAALEDLALPPAAPPERSGIPSAPAGKGEGKVVPTVDGDPSHAQRIPFREREREKGAGVVPACMTVGVYKGAVLVDPSHEEERLW